MIEDLSQDEMLRVLKTNFFGRLGLHDGNKTYIIPTNYVYDGKFILCHAVEGTKIHIMRQHPGVCLEVEEIIDVTHWCSVLAHGYYQELTEERDRYHAMKAFVDHGLHLKIPHFSLETPPGPGTPVKPGTEKPVIYRIIVTELTGKIEKK